MNDKFTEKQRLAFSLYKELKEIWRKKRALGYYKLPKPIQKGWQQQFRVREDVLRSSEGARYKEILPYVQNVRISKTTVFEDKYYHYSGNLIPFNLQKIPLYRKKDIKFPEFYWDKYFERRIDYTSGYRTGVEIKYKEVYFIKRKSAFETEIVPHYIYQLRIIDSTLESREKEIENKIEKLNLRPIINKLFGYRRYTSWDHCDIKKYNNKILRELENEVREDLRNV